MSEPKKYLNGCFARERETKFGKFLSLDCDATSLIQFVEQNTDGRGRFKLTVAPKRNPDKYGTHSVYLDEFVPTPRGSGAPRTTAPQRQFDDVPDPKAPCSDKSEVPF